MCYRFSIGWLKDINPNRAQNADKQNTTNAEKPQKQHITTVVKHISNHTQINESQNAIEKTQQQKQQMQNTYNTLHRNNINTYRRN